MMSDELNIVERSFGFAVRVVRLCRFLDEQDRVSRTLANQLLRSGTSIGANIEEAQAGQSKADFVAKMSISRKEARETLYWLRLLKAADIVAADKLTDITKEADELVCILTSIVKTSQTRSARGTSDEL
ncbi:MAG: four helix bundle protein [Verrucomicrobiales bacterium]|nr:four helix bundle protein [Verrucomicrobiales bacterium]